MGKKLSIVLAGGFIAFGTLSVRGQSASGSSQNASSPSATKPVAFAGSGSVGVGVKVSTLGVGAEVAVRVLPRANVRAGFNVLGYSRAFSKDGIPYDGHLNFKTVEAAFDFFPWAAGFHVSTGVLAYIGDPIKATTFVPGGQSFTLGSTVFYSDSAMPTTGTGKIDFSQAAPMITVGWGNLVPRRYNKHFSVPVEIGVAFQGPPMTKLNLSGNVCTSPGTNCTAAASSSFVQTQVIAEQNKISKSMSFFQTYPIISVGFGYKF
ncbi:MAG: hypothetical protein WA252_00200 [Candidatus Sulfotelmatobacter sp.]